jgi:hypothetical protein
MSRAPFFQMLFTDSDVVAMGDLQGIDSEFALVAKLDKANVSGPQSAIRQAWMECASAINKHAQLYNCWVGPAYSGQHTAYVVSAGTFSQTMPRVMLNVIVAHNWRYDGSLSAIQLWMAYVALKILYSNASDRKGEDRYEKKALRFEQKAIDAWSEMLAQGLPTVVNQMEAPGALHSHNSGTWTAFPTSGSATGGKWIIAITYFDGSAYISPSNPMNAESGPSPTPVAVTCGTNQVVSINIAALNPPNGLQNSIGISEGLTYPMNATGWNIYAAQAPADASTPVFYYQTSVPIATVSHVLPGDPVLSGVQMGMGQYPDPGRNILFHGNMIRRM